VLDGAPTDQSREVWSRDQRHRDANSSRERAAMFVDKALRGHVAGWTTGRVESPPGPLRILSEPAATARDDRAPPV
jgi:hypothetical protein